MRTEAIILYHSDERLFSACLDSLLATTPSDLSVLIVRNNENLDSCLVQRNHPRVRTLDIQEGLGYARAANLGANQSQADQFLFLDQDLIFSEGWYESLMETVGNAENAAITGVKLLSPSTGRILDYGIGLDEFNTFHLHWDRHPQFDLESDYHSVQAVCSACIAVDAESFRKIGGFDEKLGTIYTDIDLCLRMKSIGKLCYVSAKSLVYHFGSKTIDVNKTYKKQAYKSDVGGYFRMKNASNITCELKDRYNESLSCLTANSNLEKSYILVNMLNVYNSDYYVGLVSAWINLRSMYRIPTSTRDASAMNLYWHLGYHFALQNAPILYLVDRYYSLRANELWWKHRERYNDVIVDRHCTCMTVRDAIADFSVEPEIYTKGNLPTSGDFTSEM